MGLMFICEEFVILQMHLITPQHAGKSVAIACGKLVPGEAEGEEDGYGIMKLLTKFCKRAKTAERRQED